MPQSGAACNSSLGQEIYVVFTENIDEHFVSAWHPKYDDIESDEPEYQCLVAKTENICSSRSLMPVDIFRRIVHWKSPRVKGKIEWNNYKKYATEVKNAMNEPNVHGIKRLISLYGIGVPVASTILHFIHPNKIPIIDKRTTGVLSHFNFLSSTGTEIRHYPNFMDAVIKLHSELSFFTLREIDRAMFAYHKSNPKIFGRLNNPKNRNAKHC